MRFTLITLNCFGVPTPSTRSRLRALAHDLNRRDACVVCLQEVQANIYRRLLVSACTAYPYHAYEPFLHAPKGGLLTLSRIPIHNSEFTLYRDRGLWYTLAPADWLLHKGVLCTQLVVGGVPVVIINTHLTANYSANWRKNNPYARLERTQLYHLAEVVTAQPPDTLVIVAGDFNVPRGTGLYHEFIRLTDMIDPMAGSNLPTLRPPRGMPGRYAVPIDFALVRAPHLPGLQMRSQLSFQEKLPLSNGKQMFASDHYGIALDVTWDQ